MGTRAAAFNSKIRNLVDYHLRLIHGVVPPPSGLDIAGTLKCFSQTLLGVLKDIRAQPLQLLRNRDEDSARLSLFPSLDYSGLYEALVQLVDVIPLIQFGLENFVPSLVHTLCALMVFLKRDFLDDLPYVIASMMPAVPETLHQMIVNALCYNILPFTVGATKSENEDDTCADASLSAILLIVIQYSENSSHHSQLLECLLSLKRDVIKDLLIVIAHGTPIARPAASNLLFFYWPNLNPTLYERRGLHIRIAGWKPLKCQTEGCEGEGHNASSKVCYNHEICLTACPEIPPPIYVCTDCANGFVGEEGASPFQDMLLPMSQVAASCENKNCRSNEKNAIATCFSMDCTSYNGNRPIRYCAQCNNIRHNTRRGMDHIVHTTLSSIWSLDIQTRDCVIEAIVSLLNEVQPLGDKTKAKEHERLNRACLLDDEPSDTLSVEDRRLLSRYGIWLIVGLCTPNEETPTPLLGRLLGSICHWFSATQYLPDDQQGATIERLKSDYINNWLQEVSKSHFEVFVSCLLPHPVEYAKVGGHWDMLATKSEHIKEGFRRLFCLVPYDLVTLNVWERVMPHWMEAIHNDVPEKDLTDLKITLSKLLDPEMSPLGFDAIHMYQFIANRFSNTNEEVQEQTLSWLQLLSSLNIVIPIYQLLEMFQDGVNSLASKKTTQRKDTHDKPPLEPVIENDSDGDPVEWDEGGITWGCSDVEQTPPEKTLSCFILMFDVFFKQLEVQEIEKHKGVNGPVGIPFLTLLKEMLHNPCLSPHTCLGDQYCTSCDLTISFFQLTFDILAYLLPLLAIQNNRVADMIPAEPNLSQTTKDAESTQQDTPDHTANQTSDDTPNTEVEKSTSEAMPNIVTAKVETVVALDTVSHIAQEQVEAAVATAVTLTEEDVANATVNVDLPSVVGEDDKPVDLTKPVDIQEGSFWVTSQGKFKIKLSDLPPHLQVIFSLLELLERAEDCDIVYHLCDCLRCLILHGESFAQAASDYRGFLIWCQENKNILLMWSLLEAEWSHVAEICVALLLHFLTLPSGGDVFWKLCETHFHHSDWKVRFQAVEKVILIGRSLNLAAVKQCPGLQAAIAHAFCFLLSSLDDIQVAVAQRAHLYLTSLPDCGLRALVWCLEQQFDNVILDRPMIIQALHQLCSLLPDRKVLYWEFFYNRFDALYIESQIALEKHGDIAYPRDLRNSDLTSDIFARKLSRAQDALSLIQNTSAKTLSSSLGNKWPYKRTMSVPANLFNRTDKQDRAAHRVDADSGMRVFDDGSMVHQLQRALDLEETDKDTLHLLVFLLMQFLSQPLHATSDEKGTAAKVMNMVLRHLSILMGFSSQEKSFTIPPSKLRASPVFNAFLSNLPKVLDHNFHMGAVLLPTCLPVLQFCPAPHRMVDLRFPSYSLWYLQPHPRHWWLTSVLTILYKFDYTRLLLSNQILSLIRIVMTTLENHFHCCKKVVEQSLCTTNLSYSREVSQGSLGGGDGVDGTPPPSPATGAPVSFGVDRELTKTIIEMQEKVSALNEERSELGETDSEKEPSLPQDLSSERELSLHQDLLSSDVHDTIHEIVFKNILSGQSAVEEDSSHNLPMHTNVTVESVKDTLIEPHAVKKHAVTSVMASQIQAFDESYTVKIHDVQLAPKDSFTQKFGKKALSGLYGPSVSPDSTATPSYGSLSSLIIEEKGDRKWSQHGGNPSLSHASPNNQSDSDSSLAKVEVQRPRVYQAVTVKQGDNAASVGGGGGTLVPIDMRKPQITKASNGSNTMKGLQPSPLHDGHYNKSPQSPLSMMDVITVGSPIEIDELTNTSIDSQNTESTQKQFELPTPERLLQMGAEFEAQLDISVGSQQSSIIQRVWHVIGGWTNSSLSSVTNDTSEELQEVITHNTATESPITISSPKINQTLKSDQSRHSSTDHSNHSNTFSGATNIGDRDMNGSVDSKFCSTKPRGWEDVASGFYSWAEMSDGNSSKTDRGSQLPSSNFRQSSLRVGEDCMAYRCMECGECLEEFSNSDLGLCIIVLSTFVHREPGLAAPLLPRMLRVISRLASSEVFSWQYNSPMHLPGSATSVGRQFMRCVLHQLAPNQIFSKIFQTNIEESNKYKFFKTLTQALTDFNELNPSTPVQLLLENLNQQKTLPTENLDHIVSNLSVYMECALGESNIILTSSLIPLFDAFYRKILLVTFSIERMNYLLKLLNGTLRIQGIASHKNILDPISKLLSFCIQNAPLKFDLLCEICSICNRVFPRERDKLLIPRMVIFELVQALKFKTTIPDKNLVFLVQLILQDSGGTLGSNNVSKDLPRDITEISHNHQNTNAAECMRAHLHDALEFIADVHTISKIKSTCHSRVGLNDDTLGGLVKAGIAQYLALEITRGNSRDSRTIAKYLPWLNSVPTAVQQGPKEFIECVVHIRLLSWLLLGSLMHSCLSGNNCSIQCQPVPPEASCHIADHIQVILAGFPEHSKNTVQHMSSLYQTFILSQLWTLYLEQGAGSPASDTYTTISAILTDFWAKVTPAILHLVSHSKVLGEMVALHLMSLMEALQECQSSVLTKLLPLWAPVLYSQHAKMPGQLLVRLRSCQEAAPPLVEKSLPTDALDQKSSLALPSLSRWLHRLQFKMGQIEMQSSAAIQFYSV